MRWRAGDEDVFRDHVSLTDRYVHFYNALADLLAQELPGKLVGGHAYATWKNPPIRERQLRPNLLVAYVGFNDIYVSDAHRQRDLDQWRDWATLTRQLFYRPNFLNAGHGMPLVFVHKLAADLRYRAGGGKLMGADFDSLLHHWSTQGLNYYVLAKLLWNPRLDVDALLADYCRSAFGPAAPRTQQYYLELEKRTDWIAQRFEEGQIDRMRFFTAIPEFYSPAVLGRWRAQLAAALRAVPADSTHARCIRWVALGLDYASVTGKTLAAQGAPKEESARRRNAWYSAHLYDWSVCPPLLKWREPAKFFGK